MKCHNTDQHVKTQRQGLFKHTMRSVSACVTRRCTVSQPLGHPTSLASTITSFVDPTLRPRDNFFVAWRSIDEWSSGE